MSDPFNILADWVFGDEDVDPCTWNGAPTELECPHEKIQNYSECLSYTHMARRSKMCVKSNCMGCH